MLLPSVSEVLGLLPSLVRKKKILLPSDQVITFSGTGPRDFSEKEGKACVGRSLWQLCPFILVCLGCYNKTP